MKYTGVLSFLFVFNSRWRLFKLVFCSFFALLSFSCFKLFVLFMLIHQGKVEGRGRE